MLYAAIDIHKQSFQAAVLDPESGEVVEEALLRRSGEPRPLGRSLARPSRSGGDRSHDRLALGLARARRHGLRGAPR